jgi:hypothetical protein
MNLQRRLSLILMMGLLMVLSPLSAQAWRSQPYSRQSNHRAFTPRQTRGNAYGWHGQRRHWQQTRGNAYGRHGQRRHWQQPRHSFAQGRHPGYRQFRQPYMGQRHNPRSPYDRAGYSGNSQAPYSVPRSSSNSNNAVAQDGQTYSQRNYRHSGSSGNSSDAVVQEGQTYSQRNSRRSGSSGNSSLTQEQVAETPVQSSE